MIYIYIIYIYPICPKRSIPDAQWEPAPSTPAAAPATRAARGGPAATWRRSRPPGASATTLRKQRVAGENTGRTGDKTGKNGKTWWDYVGLCGFKMMYVEVFLWNLNGIEDFLTEL